MERKTILPLPLERVGERVDIQAFTLAEVLITLVIIGIIAAITVPMIYANYKKQETVSKLKKAYSTLAQVINRAQIENGSIEEWYENNKNSEDLFDIYFKPYLNVKRIQGNHIYKKGTPYNFLNGGQSDLAVIGNTPESRLLFLLEDGIFVMILTATGNANITEKPYIYIDLNYTKNPNKFGKDVFLMIVDGNKGLVPFGNSNSVVSNCSKQGEGTTCLKKIMRDGWEIKDDYPW